MKFSDVLHRQVSGKSSLIVLLILFGPVVLGLTFFGDHLLQHNIPLVSGDAYTESNIQDQQDTVVELGQVHAVAPGDWVPYDDVQNAVSNLDFVQFQEKFFLVIRTSATHFPSDQTDLRVYSSTDLLTFNEELHLKTGKDFREPRFVVNTDSLELYFSQVEVSLFDWDVQGMYQVAFDGTKWSEPDLVSSDSYLPWRWREIANLDFLSVTNMHDIWGRFLQSPLELWYRADGASWQTIPGDTILPGVFGAGHAAQLEFEFDDDGGMWALIRSEFEGSYLVNIDLKHNQHRIKKIPYRYDEANMFRSESGEMYVVSRRHLNGAVDRFDYIDSPWDTPLNMLLYSLSEKRTAIFKIDRAEMGLDLVMDLPSHGDTSSAKVTAMGDGKYLVLYYSSPLEKRPWKYSWLKGQLNRTKLYAAELHFADGFVDVNISRANKKSGFENRVF